MKTTKAAVAATLSATAAVQAAECPHVLIPNYNLPVVAKGWQAQLVLAGLTKPRSIEFDSTGALIVVESGKGITRHTFTDHGSTCLIPDDNTVVVAGAGVSLSPGSQIPQPTDHADNPKKLNHGLALSRDSNTLYASTVEAVFAWPYDADTGKVTGANRTLVRGMTNNDLVTRTLLLSKKTEGWLVVSRGSGEDSMLQAESLSSGLSQIRAFDITSDPRDTPPYDFGSDGRVLGWGLRNSVGVGEHPVTGGIYAVENSIDGVTRNGRDIHENNPGEELNFFGYLNESGGTTTAAAAGGNYGYPRCFAVWDVDEIPEAGGLKIGDQFAIEEHDTLTDEVCADEYVAPRLTLPAHYAPLDIKFDGEGRMGFVSFHGSCEFFPLFLFFFVFPSSSLSSTPFN